MVHKRKHAWMLDQSIYALAGNIKNYKFIGRVHSFEQDYVTIRNASAGPTNFIGWS